MSREQSKPERAFKTPRAAFNQYKAAEFAAADVEGSWTFRPEPFSAFLAGWHAAIAAKGKTP